MYEASFELRHECPYRAFSEQFPDVTIREWHHSDCQVLELTSSAAPDEELRAAVEDIGTILHSATTDDGMCVIARSCQCPIEGSIIELFQDHNCIHMPPTVYQRGWEQYSVVGFTESDIQGLLQELDDSREIDVLSKTSIEQQQLPHSTVLSVDRLFDDLTAKQLAALRLALDNDYYTQPRGASVEELAALTDVARATFEEHLRKAENKLISNAGQFVRLLTGSQPTESLSSQTAQPARSVETD